MTLLFTVLALMTAVAAGVRSSWSPCGRSMLSTITPLAERGRASAYRRTSMWFVAGSLSGGACLGAVMCGLAVAASAVPTSVAAAVAALAAGVAAASDAHVGGFALPSHRRQVNELWLDQFRPWVYGAGFGWQIGAGFATYIVTAALYLMVVMAALSGNPLASFATGLAFGAVRGVAVLAGHRITDTAALVAFHRRFDATERPVRSAVIAWEVAAALAGLMAWGAWLWGASGTLALGLMAAGGAAFAAFRGRPARVSPASHPGGTPVLPARAAND